MPTVPNSLHYCKAQSIDLVGPPPFWHQQTEFVDNKAGICIHPVYQINAGRIEEDVFTSGQCPIQGGREQEAPKAEAGSIRDTADLPDSN